MTDWPALPVFLAVAGRPAILLGDGPAAIAKRRLLERAGAVVTGDIAADARIAIVALDDDTEAQAAVARLRARGILVNAVDRPALCDFMLPAIVDRAPLLVAVGTGGVSAGLAAAVRQRLEGTLSPLLGGLAKRLHAARDDLRMRFPDAAGRRRAIADALGQGLIDDPARADEPGWLDRIEAPPASRHAIIRLTSRDPDALTLHQARLLANADRIVHARDIPLAILARARADAERVPEGRQAVPERAGLTVAVEMMR